MRYILYGPDGLTDSAAERLDDVPEPESDQVLWLDVTGLADGDMIAEIGQRFGLHPLALEDVVHVHQRAKLEEYGDHLFIVIRSLMDDDVMASEQVSLFLGSNFVITIQEYPGDCFQPVRDRLQRAAPIRVRHADYLMYALIDANIDAYFPRLERIGEVLDELDEDISNHTRDGLINRLHHIRRQLVHMRKLLWQHREALSSMTRVEQELISDETQIYLRDCLDHVGQLIDVSETDKDSCIGLQELYLAELGQKTNDVMKVLTLIATLFMPMTFVAGVYGMNFDPDVSPWNMPELRWYYGYPAAWVVMLLAGVSMTWFFWRRGWFRR